MRNEVAHLKQLLLAHKDCPVTNMQKKTAYLGGLPLLLPSSYSYSTQMNVLAVALAVFPPVAWFKIANLLHLVSLVVQ